jgi:uncharacterized protein (TIGR03067 family)
MRETTSAVLALCALAALAGRAADPDPEPPGGAAELKKLQGTWAVTKMLAKGDEFEPRAGMTYTFDGDKLTRARPVTGRGGLKQTFKVKLDTRRRPHTIELIPEGADKGQTGVYKLVKGELYLAMGTARAPADLSGKGAPVLVMKRVKAKK